MTGEGGRIDDGYVQEVVRNLIGSSNGYNRDFYTVSDVQHNISVSIIVS